MRVDSRSVRVGCAPEGVLLVFRFLRSARGPPAPRRTFQGTSASLPGGVEPRILRNPEEGGLQIASAGALRERRSDVDEPGDRGPEVPGLDPMVRFFEDVLSTRPV